jgi:type III pantothenate kinase
MEPAVINALNRLSQRFVLFDHLTPLPIVNCYQTPETLGHDRIAAAVGAVHLCPNSNLLIIDAGSAVTYDFVSAERGYLGGNIAPGIKMRLTALNQMTKRLPKVEVEQNTLTPLFGKNTQEAITAGVVRGLVFEVKGYIRSLKDQKISFKTYITGGHAPYILNAMKHKEVVEEPNLVLIGLNCILNSYSLKV